MHIITQSIFTVMDSTSAPPQSCVLPLEPNIQNVKEQGTRFGLAEDSRFEFQTFAGLVTDMRKELRLK